MKSSNTSGTQVKLQPAPLYRRLGALLYDSFILLSLLMLAGAAIVGLNGGKAVSSENYMFKIYLISVVAVYLCGSWYYGQQTIGMRAWRLFLYQNNGEKPTLKQCIIRFFAAIPSLLCAGIGLLWCIFDSKKRSLYDLAAGTRMVVIPKAKTAN